MKHSINIKLTRSVDASKTGGEKRQSRLFTFAKRQYHRAERREAKAEIREVMYGI